MSDDMGSLYEDLQHECIELRAERDALLKDAERYRGLKTIARRIDFAGLCVSDMGQLDARIDAALAAKGRG